MTTILAKTILRSRNLAMPEKVVSTLLLHYPRCIHAEFMTHRLFSRNAASSRAIPVERQIQAILDDPYIPLVWGANQKGMQSSEECSELISTMKGEEYTREAWWLTARDYAVEMARGYAKAGYHKQIVNRLLEPFSHIIVVCSSTEWSNFLALRDHKDAEPHFQLLAKEVRKCLENDPVQDLKPGKWHLPFITESDWDEAAAFARHTNYIYPNTENSLTSREVALQLLIEKSVACCASTSYKTVEGFDMDQEKAHAIYTKLVKSDLMHASPLEHVCQTDDWFDHNTKDGILRAWSGWGNPNQHGNFVGFRQYRKMLPGECQ